ncbi:MAG: hypothetical protein IPN17_33105 [Deltaproteobacteria bacterium]|nr:hypothetical protein [Deltaproteobacteria bacterium]
MTQWVIDEKPFDVLAEQCRASAPRFEPGMVTVVDELERRASVSSFFWRRDLLDARNGDGKRIIAVHPVMNDTPAFEYLFSGCGLTLRRETRTSSSISPSRRARTT